jgi:hypothetical protein
MRGACVVGKLAGEFVKVRPHKAAARAKWWFCRQVFSSLGALLFRFIK